MENIVALLKELNGHTEHKDKLDSNVSAVSVGWHIAHITLVVKQIVEQVNKSNPVEYKWKFNKSRFFVFTLGKIPRGKGKAPKAVQVEKVPEKDELEKYIDFALEKFKILDTLNASQHFIHPYFGMLHVKATKRMLHIHTNHHMRIIRDIIKKSE